MKLAIMQPYFLPYIGYFQLIQAAETFVIYDNIQYTKKGWINRNRYLLNGREALFSIALKKDSDYLDIRDREIAASFDRQNLLIKIDYAYKKAKHYEDVFPLFKRIISYSNHNLFEYIYHSVNEICKYLEINTTIIKSSHININHELKSQDKVIAICRELGARQYINAIGGKGLYSKDVFISHHIDLKFIEADLLMYKQYEYSFVPWLSILDVLMFNSVDEVRNMLNRCKLV